jgi:hypothetical protein
VQADGAVAVYSSATTPNLGTAAADGLQIEFFGSAAGAGLDGEAKGTFNLATGIDNNYATCARCIRVFEDPSVPGRVFFQQSGTLVINQTSDQLKGTVSATITNLTLVEVTIDGGTFVSTPVPNGACLHIASAPIAVTPPVVPGAWTCNPSYYGDGSCDCGCGVIDSDCPDALIASCEWCDVTGSCSENVMDCPGIINPTNNALCTP